MHDEHHGRASNLFRSPATWVLLAFLAIAAFFLIAEHTAHVLGVLPFLLVLACPLLHLFLHGRHGRGHAGHGSRPSPRSDGGER